MGWWVNKLLQVSKQEVYIHVCICIYPLSAACSVGYSRKHSRPFSSIPTSARTALAPVSRPPQSETHASSTRQHTLSKQARKASAFSARGPSRSCAVWLTRSRLEPRCSLAAAASSAQARSHPWFWSTSMGAMVPCSFRADSRSDPGWLMSTTAGATDRRTDIASRCDQTPIHDKFSCIHSG